MHKRLILTFQTPVHHGSGFGLAGLVDRPFLRDIHNEPYLSGAAIKGKFRWAALRLLRSRSVSVCTQEPGEFCREKPCAICRLFGSPRFSGLLTFQDAHLIPEQRSIVALATVGSRTAGATIRATTALERQRRVVKADHLFTTEVIPALTFESVLRGPAQDADAQLVLECTRVLTHFGADSSRGLGQCNYALAEPRS